MTYSGPVESGVRWRGLLREIASELTPVATGLWARHWRLDRRAITGRYLIDDHDAGAGVEQFAESDPALAQIRDHGPWALEHPTGIEEIAALDIFDRPLVIVAAPRSGSTMLYELLAKNDHFWTIDGESEGVIEGVPTLHPASRGFESHRLTEQDVNPAVLATVRAGFVAELRNRSGTRYLELPEHERPRAVRMLEKTTENSLRVPFMAAIFPNARFVFLHRDGRQNVNSILEAWHHEGFVKIPALPGWRRGRWHFALAEGWRAFNDASLLDVAAFQWAVANRTALHDLEGLAPDRWMSVDYAELVASHRAAALRICEFADVDVDEQLQDALTRPLHVGSTAISPPSPVKWRSNPEFREEAVRRYRSVSARLRDLGSESAPPPPRRTSAAPVRFSCFVDELPPATDLDGGDYVVAPSFRFQMGSTVPLDLLRRTRFRERFLADHPLLWIEDPRTRIVYPFWGRRRQAFLYRQFVAGAPPPTDLGADDARRLACGGILTRAEEIERLRSAGDELVAESGRQFSRDGYCVLSSLVWKSHIAALARYYRSLIEYGEWAAGDEQVRRRYGYHNETVARYFHHQLKSVVSRVVGEPAKPTYAYVSAYQEGAVLKPHVDREQCVFTLSLWVDEDTDLEAEPWPLWFHVDHGKVTLTQKTGDAVLFRGSDLPHWRNAPPSVRASTTLLLHYVPESFKWPLD